jgi:N-acetylglucosaminyldiphosphoundecaprenol N-acetyl-beta-D-mannosaminyltransferase
VSAVDHGNDIIINLNGRATAENVDEAIRNFQNLVRGTTKRVALDLSHCHFVDARFFGLFLMLRKTLKTEGRELRFTGVSPSLRRLFGLNEVGFLLSPA